MSLLVKFVKLKLSKRLLLYNFIMRVSFSLSCGIETEKKKEKPHHSSKTCVLPVSVIVRNTDWKKWGEANWM